jgi:hypothetical protein
MVQAQKGIGFPIMAEDAMGVGCNIC